MQNSQNSTVLREDYLNPPEKLIKQAPLKYSLDISSGVRIIPSKEPILRGQVANCFLERLTNLNNAQENLLNKLSYE